MTQQIKTFSQLVEELKKRSEADDPYSPNTDRDSDEKELKPRAPGEKKFKDDHKVEVKKHPVAGDNQFNGTTKPAGDHKGPEGKGEPVIKQGSSDIKNTHDGSKSPDTSKAAGKRFGDLRVVNPIKEEVEQIEEVELEETAFRDLQNIARTKKEGRVKFSNGRIESVDFNTASALVSAHSKLNSANKKKFEESINKDFGGMMRMVDFAVNKK